MERQPSVKSDFPDAGVQQPNPFDASRDGSTVAVGGNHVDTGHYAVIYETDDQRFETATAFLETGLQRNERCLYITCDDDEEAAILNRLRARDVDVAAARERGQLEFYSVQDTYLRTEPFDPDAMLAFYETTIETTLESYDGLRVTAGTGWIDEVDVEDFMEYEGRVNKLFETYDAQGLCHYDRRSLPPSVIRDVIQTHPHLIYDNELCHNFYYMPADEHLDSNTVATETDQMLQTLRDQTRTKASLASQKRFLQTLNEVTGDPHLTFEEKLHRLFDLVCDQFDLDLGGLNRVDPETDRFEVEYLSDEHEFFEVGKEIPLSETFCRAPAEIMRTTSISDPVAEGLDDIEVYETYGGQAYIGTHIPMHGADDRTFAFLSTDPRDEPFPPAAHTLIELIGQWIKHELEHRQREEFLQTCYEITSDPEQSFEQKFERLIALGCDRFDLDHGGLCRVDPEDDYLEVERIVGDHDVIEEGLRAELSETYCQVPVDASQDPRNGVADAVDMTDPDEQAFEGKLCYETFGVRTYLGTHLAIDGGLNRTFWFISNEPRERPISDDERMYIRLMGQWVKYELERKQRERALEQTNAQLRTLNNLYEVVQEITWKLAHQSSRTEIESVVCHRLSASESYDTAWIQRIEDDEVIAATRDATIADDELRLSSDEGAIERARRTGRTQVIRDGPDPTPRGLEGGLERPVAARATVPLTYDDDLYGVLHIDTKRERAFEDVEFEVLDHLGEIIGLALVATERKQALHRERERLEFFNRLIRHNLLNSLNVVNARLGILEPHVNRAGEEHMTVVRDRTERMIDLIESLRTLMQALVESGGKEVEAVDLGRVLHEQVREVDQTFEDVVFEFDGPVDEAGAVLANDLLGELFQNLLFNAVQHNDKQTPRVVVGVEPGEAAVTVRIADNGPGVSEELRTRIFEKGQKSLESTGTGFGLHLAREIVGAYGGSIWVEDNDPEGAVFAVELPRPELPA